MNVLTPEEVAARWRCSPLTIYRALAAKTLNGFKVGRLWRIHLEAVEKLEKGA